MSDFVDVASADEIPVGQFKAVTVGGRHLLVCHIAEGFYAIDDTCTHDDGSLADGWLDGQALECPRHGARFDVTTGAVLALPAPVSIRTYPVQVDGGRVRVQVG